MRPSVLIAALALLAAGCGGYGDDDDGKTGAPAAPMRTITITETDFDLDPSSVALDRPGTFAFAVVNEGEVAHALEIEGEGIEEETETLEPGERGTLTLALEAGEYELYCPVGDHADRGMRGKLEVAGTSDRSGNGY